MEVNLIMYCLGKIKKFADPEFIVSPLADGGVIRQCSAVGYRKAQHDLFNPHTIKTLYNLGI